MQRKLLKAKEKLVKFKEPVLFLERSNGLLEIYHNVKEQEWIVPGCPAGVEKKILLGRQWQIDIPYAGRSFKAYWCHEDWVFPHKWGEPTRYQGKHKDAPNDGWILTTANMASEIFRDRERKVLMAWEKFKAKSSKWDFVEIAKAVAIVVGIAIAGLWAWGQWGPSPEPQTIVGGAQAATGVVLG